MPFRLGGLSRLLIPRTLTAGSVVTAVTALRVGTGWTRLWAGRAPGLAALALHGALGNGEAAQTSQAAFRDGVLALARDSAQRSWQELRRGVDDLDALTRGAAGEDGRLSPGARTRPYRVKP